jgi:hypothetical protein
MIMTYTGYLMTALGYIAGFVVLALFWIWLVLVFADAIAQLWRELVSEFVRGMAVGRRRLSVNRFRGSSPTRKQRCSGPRTSPADRSSSSAEDASVATASLAVSTEDTPEAVPLFVVDAPLFQADTDVLDARPANILEILEDACSVAKAAGHSDEEIARMLAGDSRFADRSPFRGDST